MTVAKYCEVTKTNEGDLKKVATPSIPEEAKWHPARAPRDPGSATCVCPWCRMTLPVDEVGKLHSPPESCGSQGQSDGQSIKEETREEVRGTLAPHAASVLVKLLYAATC